MKKIYIINDNMKTNFLNWAISGNVIEIEKGIFSTQDTLYKNRIKGVKSLYKYFIKELINY